MKLTIDIQDNGVSAALARLRELGGDLQKPLGSIGHSLVENTRLRIRAGGPAPNGTPWAPMSPVTRTLRRKHGRGAELLRDTGRLRNTLTYYVASNSVTVGSNLVYAQMLQLGAAKGAFGKTRRGAPIPWGNVPPRPYLGMSSGDRSEVLGILRNAIQRAAEGR